MKAKFEKNPPSSKFQQCIEQKQIVEHLVCGCKRIAQAEHLEDTIKWPPWFTGILIKNYNLPAKKNRNHNIEKVDKNKGIAILQDFQIQNNKHVVHNKPDNWHEVTEKRFFLEKK